jgi:hypothetical protein
MINFAPWIRQGAFSFRTPERDKISERLAAARPEHELSAEVVQVFGTPETFSAGAYKPQMRN